MGHTAVGDGAKTLANRATAVGVSAKTEGTSSIAFGDRAYVSSQNSTAIGSESKVLSQYSTAIGASTSIDIASNQSTAIGLASSITSSNFATALGTRAKVTNAAYGVALGTDSVANRASGMVGYDPKTAAKSTETNATWKATKGAVSIGKADGSDTRQITGVAAGTVDTDAVNVAQLKEVAESAAAGSSQVKDISAGFNMEVTSNDQGVYTVATTNKPVFGSVSVNTDDSGTITGLTNKTLDAGDFATAGRAATEEQLKAAMTVVSSDISKPMTFAGDTGSVAKKLGETMKIKGDGGNISTEVVSGELVVKLTDRPVFGGVSVNTDGNGTVNGLTNKTWNPDAIVSGQAATEDQLKAVDDKVAAVGEADQLSVKYDSPEKNSVPLGGAGTGHAPVKLTNVASGDISENSTDAVNGSLLWATNQQVAQNTTNITNLTTQVGELANGTSWNAAVEAAEGGTATGGDTPIKRDGKMTYAAGDNISMNFAADGDGNGKLTVALNKYIKIDSVTSNSYKVEDKTYINEDGINANSLKITNIAAGENDTDAVNYGQLKELTSNFENWGNVIRNMDVRLDSVGAMAAAMSAMIPLGFDEEHRKMITAGLGHYSGENAIAIGVMHYANRDLLFNGELSMSRDQQMYRLGATFRLGKSPEQRKISTTEQKALMQVNELQKAVDSQQEQIDKQNLLIEELLERMKEIEASTNK